MTADPRVAVVITCYNLGRYLDEAVQSVLGQTLRDFEIVIVDDGSDEPETVRLLERYARPQTRVIHSPNRGLSAARNLGIRETTGEYICALDADDILESSCLEKSVRALDEDPRLAFVSHWVRAFGDEAFEWRPDRCDLASLLDQNTVNSAAVVRREIVAAVGGFDETLTRGFEDWAFWLDVVSRGFPGAIIPEVLFRYRRRPDSMSRRMMVDGTYLDFFQYRLERYSAAYRRHAVELAVKRAVPNWNLCRDIHDLEAEFREWLEPDVRRWRERVDALREKVERVEQRTRPVREARTRVSELEAEVETARARIAQMEAERAADVEAARARIALLDRQGRGAEAQIANQAAEIAALRRSVSWRLTAPFRYVGAWLLRLKGGF
jgi:glycosyltransferase involved in cell wall biosynthesis